MDALFKVGRGSIASGLDLTVPNCSVPNPIKIDVHALLRHIY